MSDQVTSIPGTGTRKKYREGILKPGREWQMLVDLKKQLIFPREITITTFRPDIVMWSAEDKIVIIIELTIQWEGNSTADHERKHLKCSKMAAECQEAGWNANVYPVEVGCRGFVSRAMEQLLLESGIAGVNLQKTVKELEEEAEKAAGGGRETFNIRM